MSVRMSGMPIKPGHVYIVVALIFAVVSAVMIQNIAVKKATPKKVAKLETQSVTVASANLPAGTTIAPEDVTVVEWPSKYLVSANVFDDKYSVVGRTVKSDLVPGEPVYKQKLTGDKSSGGLPVLIPKGFRAITIGVSETKGVAGFVNPGDRVDVLVTVNEGGRENKLTKIVLQNVLVLASAQQMVRASDMNDVSLPKGLTEPDEEEVDPKNKKAPKKKEKSAKELEKERKEKAKLRKEQEKRAKSVSSVTLALTPEESEKMALAEESGDIRLVLRSEGDTSVAQTMGAQRQLLLLGDTAPWPAPPSAMDLEEFLPDTTVELPPGKSVEFIEGPIKTNLTF